MTFFQRVSIWLNILKLITKEDTPFSKKHRSVSKTIATYKMELYLELVSEF